MNSPVQRKKRRTVTLEVDMHAVLEGFDSASAPTPAHHRIVRHYASPLLLGPPPSDVLLELVLHMFTDDEADIVQHLPPLRPRKAATIARLAGRPLGETERILERLAGTKIVLFGAGTPRKYAIMPIVPGTFEAALMTPDLSTRNAWHKRFAELFERLWETGFLKDYVKSSMAPMRALPVGAVSSSLFMAWPSDRLEEFLEPYDLFAIGQCQCRVAMQLVGKGCHRPTMNCVGIGPLAQLVIDRGMMRKADRSEVIEAKRTAEQAGCITWMANELGDRRGNVSCSCCSCCCHALRSLTDLDTPGMFSPPHFLPAKQDDACTSCVRCVAVCPTGAWVGATGDQPVFFKHKCIGCGLCVVHCNAKALALEPVPDCRPPQDSWLSLLTKMAPSYLSNASRVWMRRLWSP